MRSQPQDAACIRHLDVDGSLHKWPKCRVIIVYPNRRVAELHSITVEGQEIVPDLYHFIENEL